jgi:hypothetical protein
MQAIKNIEQLMDEREEAMVRQKRTDAIYLESGEYTADELKGFIGDLEDPTPRM